MKPFTSKHSAQYLTELSPLNKEEEKKMSRKKYDKKMERATKLDEKSFEKDEKKFNSGAKLRRRAGKIRGKLNINNVED